MAALLYAIASHRHWLFLVLFTVSCYNKETTVFAAIAYVCYLVDRMPYQAFLPMVFARGVVFSLIYFGLHRRLPGNPGKALENWTAEQLAFLGRRSFADYLSWLGGILLVAYHWPDKPSVMRRSSWMLVPDGSLALTFAYPGEVGALARAFPTREPLRAFGTFRNS